jgi:hypothetical protein
MATLDRSPYPQAFSNHHISARRWILAVRQLPPSCRLDPYPDPDDPDDPDEFDSPCDDADWEVFIADDDSGPLPEPGDFWSERPDDE